MRRSNVRISSAPGVLLAEFDEGRRLVMTGHGCYEPDRPLYERVKQKLGPELKMRTVEDSAVMPLAMSLTIAASITGQLLVPKQGNGNCGTALYMAILALSLLIHEAGHAAVLKMFLPEARITLGFRFMFVFPAIYVNTTASYLLPKGKRAAVHLAGIFANALSLVIGNLLIPGASSANAAIAWMMLLNLVPIMKGDGYQTLAALLEWHTPALSEGRRAAQECARGVAMLALVIVLSRLVA